MKPGAAQEEIRKVMPTEVTATVRLYLDGKIQQWYARGNGKGVIFLMNCGSVVEAKSLTHQLPLIKAGFAKFNFMPLAPLTPLCILLQPATGGQPSGK